MKKVVCENVCLLVRRLILNGDIRSLVLVKKTGDGTFEFLSFSGETEHTVFIDDTLAVVDDSFLKTDPRIEIASSKARLFQGYIVPSSFPKGLPQVIISPGEF